MPTSHPILLTAATGKSGYPAAQELLRQGWPVRILVRHRNAHTQALEQQGAEVILGDIRDRDVMQRALQGIRRVYYCYPFQPGLRPGTQMFIAEAERAGVEYVVNMGQWLAQLPNQASGHTNAVRATYADYAASRLQVIHLIPGFFADNMRFVLEFVVQFGLLMAPHGQGRNPAVSNEDLGLCIAALLQNPAPYVGQRLRPTGPVSLHTRDMAAVFSQLLGRRIRYVHLPTWLFLRGAVLTGKQFGVDEFTLSQARHYYREYQAGSFDIGGPTDVVQRLTGKAPDPFTTIAARWLAAYPRRERNLRNWLTAVRHFLLIPLQRVPALANLDRLAQ